MNIFYTQFTLAQGWTYMYFGFVVVNQLIIDIKSFSNLKCGPMNEYVGYRCIKNLIS